MSKIQGIKNLMDYLETIDYPLTEQQIQLFLSEKQIPHSNSFGNTIFFNLSHIDWWVTEQRKLETPEKSM
ncbi:hypothetical protein [Planococcus sp. YIM B11945]|uniref:hypothetical protein n=1 Tax=Planococcus sp. YIM B11945 TaxID=3435410 RepID=UPI003D7E1A78